MRIVNYRVSLSSRALNKTASKAVLYRKIQGFVGPAGPKKHPTAERPSRPRPFAFGSEDICTREASSRGQKNDLYTAVENVHVMTKEGKTDAHMAVQNEVHVYAIIHPHMHLRL